MDVLVEYRESLVKVLFFDGSRLQIYTGTRQAKHKSVYRISLR